MINLEPIKLKSINLEIYTSEPIVTTDLNEILRSSRGITIDVITPILPI